MKIMAEKSGRGCFPTTDWGLLADVRGNGPAAKLAALDILIRRYWKPVFLFLRHSGSPDESAKDSTQAFFADWIDGDAFAKADERKGRFRSFMLTCLKRFVSNEHRAAHAQKRGPPEGLLSLDELMSNPDMPFEPAHNMTPEAIFQKAWAAEVVRRVLKHLEIECNRTGKTAHFDIFSRRIISPILDGSPEPSMADLGREHGFTEKQASNYLLTAKRAYQRLLQEEIRLYASSETEVASEILELFSILGK
jgi:DNA-directed RNA polymerase specialized sigma24 family protein